MLMTQMTMPRESILPSIGHSRSASDFFHRSPVMSAQHIQYNINTNSDEDEAPCTSIECRMIRTQRTHAAKLTKPNNNSACAAHCQAPPTSVRYTSMRRKVIATHTFPQAVYYYLLYVHKHDITIPNTK